MVVSDRLSGNTDKETREQSNVALQSYFWSTVLAGLLEQGYLPALAPAAVQFSWPAVCNRLITVYSLFDQKWVWACVIPFGRCDHWRCRHHRRHHITIVAIIIITSPSSSSSPSSSPSLSSPSSSPSSSSSTSSSPSSSSPWSSSHRHHHYHPHGRRHHHHLHHHHHRRRRHLHQYYRHHRRCHRHHHCHRSLSYRHRRHNHPCCLYHYFIISTNSIVMMINVAVSIVVVIIVIAVFVIIVAIVNSNKSRRQIDHYYVHISVHQFLDVIGVARSMFSWPELNWSTDFSECALLWLVNCVHVTCSVSGTDSITLSSMYRGPKKTMNMADLCLWRNYLVFACCTHPHPPLSPSRSESPDQDGG